MRKIMTLGLTAITASTVLAFGSPMAAHAGTPTENACTQTLTNYNNLNNTLTNDKNAFQTARQLVDVVPGNKLSLLTTATDNAANAAAAYVAAQTAGGDVTTTKSNYDAAVSAFNTAASNWLNAHIDAVTKRNSVTGDTFLLNFIVKTYNAIGGPCTPALPLPTQQPVEANL